MRTIRASEALDPKELWRTVRLQEAEIARLRAVARAVILFYRPDWTPERQAEWEALTGQDEASTRTLADFARAALPDHLQ